ncbi:MAG TPA: S8 family serine peptidase [Acidobacteriota bacterium]|nr:S8 family serine peptidase [Acidobacteriota bacterium]
MKQRLTIVLLLLLLGVPAEGSAALTSDQAAKLTPTLADQIERAGSDAVFEVLVTTRSSQSQSDLRATVPAGLTRAGRYCFVADGLRQAAQEGRKGLAAVAASRPAGQVEIIRGFWISPTVHLRADRDALLELSARDDVLMIAPNFEVELMHPVLVADATDAATGAEANLGLVGVRSLWALGLTGAGRLVASIDTGVEGVHPALADRWRGLHGDTASSWFDPYGAVAPADQNGHGTHVMGVMVGRAGADTIGLAPDAEWITAAVIDRGASLATTFADILSALEWVADPDGNPETTDDVPDVVCNSWGVAQHIINPCDQYFFDAIDNVEALGIVCVFAAGNEGPYSMTIRNPADRGTTTTASFSVGAVDGNDPAFSVPAFSSRGPSACDGFSIKPELVAPGVDIRSSYKGGTYKTISGTSMAAPHVAAAVALLRQYNPDLTPEEIKLALMSSARDVGNPGEDNATGHGLIDLEAALNAVRPPLVPTILVQAVRPDLTGDAILNPGETGPVAVTLSGMGPSLENLSAQIVPLSTGVTAPVDLAYFGTLNDGESVDNATSPFVVSIAPDFRAGDTARFELRLSGYPQLADWRDTIGFACGLPPDAAILTIGAGDGALSISNFGQVGLGPGSILDAGGEGWRVPGAAANILYESSLIITSADGRVADASRNGDGSATFDFAPLSDPIALASGALGSVFYDDSRAADPVGISARQTAVYQAVELTYNLIIVEWTIRSRTGFPIDGIRVGWVTDIDVPAAGAASEMTVFEPVSGGIYHTATIGGYDVAGFAPLGFAFGSMAYVANDFGRKPGLTVGEKLAALAGGTEPTPMTAGDWFEVVATGPVNLGAYDSLTVAVVFISADDPAAFAAGWDDARRRWSEIAGVFDDYGDQSMLPRFTLAQNYPNPFNAATTIPIEIGGPGADAVRLDIFDILGRRVRTLFDGPLPAGSHAMPWDGTDRRGRTLASGVYLFRLTVEGQAQTRRMVLLK